MRLSRCAALLVAAGVLSSGLVADTIVRARPDNDHPSPMVLETDFILTNTGQWDQKQWHEAVAYRDLARHICEDLTVSYFAMDVQSGKNGGPARIRVKGRLRNIGRRDKEANVQVDLVKGKTVLASLAESGVEIEENEEAGWGGSLRVNPSQLTSQPEPRVRITITVER
ncbi:MAG: hypothetical protein ACREAA_18820 [Candidatus Polarisedimenticolia bacterium]